MLLLEQAPFFTALRRVCAGETGRSCEMPGLWALVAVAQTHVHLPDLGHLPSLHFLICNMKTGYHLWPLKVVTYKLEIVWCTQIRFCGLRVTVHEPV